MGGKGSGRKRAVPFIPDPTRVAWDRQPDETDKAWAAFVIYRDFDVAERTILAVAHHFGKTNAQHYETWSAKYGWRYRVEEFDRDQDRKARKEAERVRLEVIEAQTKDMLAVTQSMWQLAAIDLQLWHGKIKQLIAINEAKAAETNAWEYTKAIEPMLSPADIKNLTDAGMKLQRLLEEKPTEIGEQRAQITIDDRRRRLQRGLADPDVRDAMRLVSEKLGTADATG